MKNINKLLTLLMTSMIITACNGGSSGGGSADVQNGDGSASLNGSTITYNYTATGCKTIQIGNSCNVSLTYQTSGGSIYNGPLYMRTYNTSYEQTSGFVSNVSSACPNASTALQSCNFTITATESASTTTQAVALIAGSNFVSNMFVNFQIGQ